MHPEEDTELLRRYVREKAQDAFAELVRRHLDFVYAAALRRTGGKSDLAADAAQQAFAAFARNAKALERHPTVAGWLYTTTRQLAASSLRSERARKLREEAFAMHECNSAPDADPAWNEIRPHLEELVQQLDDPDRDAIVRRYFSNQKFTEMGAALHLSEDAARMRVERALKRLRTLLRRRGVTSTTAAISTLLVALPAGATAPAGLAATVTSAAAALAPLATQTAVVAILNFMSPSKVVGITIGLAALIGTGGLYLARQTGKIEALLHTIHQTEVVDGVTMPRADVRPKVVARNAKQGDGVSSVEPFVPVPMDPAEERALIEHQRALSPAVKENTLINSDRIRVRVRFHAIYSILGLNHDEIERFEKLAAVKHLTFTKVIGTPEQKKSILEANFATLNRVVTEALGAQYVPAFRDYVATSNLRGIAGELAANTYYTDTPLTAAQADQFLQVCVECHGPEAVDAYIEPATVDWPAVLARAEQFLSPQQLQALRARLARHLFDFEYERATGLPLHRPIHGL